MKRDEVSPTDANHFACRCGEIIVHGPSMEKISDCSAVLALENYADQPPVVFSVSECDVGGRLLRIEVAKAEFQTDEEKALPVPKTFAVLVYRRAPFVCKHCQTLRSEF